MTKKVTNSALSAVIVSALIIIGLCPFLLIWGINELSEQGGLSFELPYNFWTWLSCIAIAAVLRGDSSK